MDIPTFGALLRFAMELEERQQKCYEDASLKTENASIKETLLDLAQGNKKSQAQIQRLYNESIFSDMDTGVQEPIPGLTRSDYLDEGAASSDAAHADSLKLAILGEDTAERFYRDGASQVKARRPAVARSLEKLAKEKTERKAMLKAL